jgi:predicted double-glycine peptidase
MSTEKLLLDVPFYRQTRQYTCGSSSLMMVLKYWNKKFVFSEKMELNLWRKTCSLFFFGGALQFGIARTAKKMGLTTKIYQKYKYCNNFSFTNIFYCLYTLVMSYTMKKNDIPIYYNNDLIGLLQQFLSDKKPVIFFINLKPITGENILHWLVVTGIDKKNVYVNDPGVTEKNGVRKNFPIDLESFKRAISTDQVGNIRLPPCLVIVEK